jgi:serine protease Do
MKRFQKFAAVVALGGVGTASWFMGNSLIQDVRFARADDQVQGARQDLRDAKDLEDVFRAVGKAVEPSVVSIEVHKTVHNEHPRMDQDFLRRFFPNMPEGQGQGQGNGDDQQNPPDSANPNQGDTEEVGEGSGVIMDASDGYGYILTNNHVAGGASKMIVTLYNGDVIKDCKLMGADPKSDLAVVRIKADHLIPAKWGDSDTLEKGDWICAFGAPFNFVGSMTHGIVSALNRQNVGIIDRQSGFSYENFIQVDAPINPGNSGGPLVNLHGEVVGINTAIASRNGGFEGIGFAIPSDQAHPIYEALKDKGKVIRGWLGVEIGDVQHMQDEVAATGYKGDNGVFVEGTMFNTPATGKLQAGDVITALNGKPIETAAQLRNAIAVAPPGTEVSLTVSRNGKTQDVSIKLGEQPADLSQIAAGGRHSDEGSGTVSAESLGLQLTDVTDELATRYNLQGAKSGAVVTTVDPNSPAAAAGVNVGDLITKVAGKDVQDASSAADAISKADPSKGIAMNITNREGSHFVFIKTEK